LKTKTRQATERIGDKTSTKIIQVKTMTLEEGRQEEAKWRRGEK